MATLLFKLHTAIKKESRLSKAALGHYKKSNIQPAMGQVEFRVKELDDTITIGSDVKVDTFKAGEHVDITGKTLGKGFQGGVKRHQDATYGNSISHRALGSDWSMPGSRKSV